MIRVVPLPPPVPLLPLKTLMLAVLLAPPVQYYARVVS